MLKDLFNHGEELRQLIAAHPKNCDWSKQLEQHRICLQNLQHERLIHLLVTLTVALLAVILCLVFIAKASLLLGIAALLLACLLLPYLWHYRKLENMVQDWYTLSRQLDDLND